MPIVYNVCYILIRPLYIVYIIKADLGILKLSNVYLIKQLEEYTVRECYYTWIWGF